MPLPSVRTTDQGEAEYTDPGAEPRPTPAAAAEIARAEDGSFTVKTDTSPEPTACASFADLTAFLGQSFGATDAGAPAGAAPPAVPTA